MAINKSPDSKQQSADLAQQLGMEGRAIRAVEKTLSKPLAELLTSTVAESMPVLARTQQVRNGLPGVEIVETSWIEAARKLEQDPDSILGKSSLTTLLGTEIATVIGATDFYQKLVNLVLTSDPAGAEKYIKSLQSFLLGQPAEPKSRRSNQQPKTNSDRIKFLVGRIFDNPVAPASLIAEMAENTGFVLSKDLVLKMLTEQFYLKALTLIQVDLRLAKMRGPVSAEVAKIMHTPVKGAENIGAKLDKITSELEILIADRNNALTNIQAGAGFSPLERVQHLKDLERSQSKITGLQFQRDELTEQLSLREMLAQSAVNQADIQLGLIKITRETRDALVKSMLRDNQTLQLGVGTILQALVAASSETENKRDEVIKQYLQVLQEGPKKVREQVRQITSPTEPETETPSSRITIDATTRELPE